MRRTDPLIFFLINFISFYDSGSRTVDTREPANGYTKPLPFRRYPLLTLADKSSQKAFPYFQL